MRIYLLLVVAYILMASCIAKGQRNLGLFTSLGLAVASGIFNHKANEKMKKNLQEVDTDASSDLQVCTLV